ncbi:MAG: WhiB family transcriptional regulator [Pseudonocardiaceae bacterium]|nr:WhiB family transcriptional regulator [Pseudonocardiaceae bacterium]
MSLPTVPRTRGAMPEPYTAAGEAFSAGLANGLPPVDLDLPCRLSDPDLWFAEAPTDLEHAKALCADCPIRAECLAGALERREPWGVWGGEIFERGVVVGRKRPRGRPRKADVAARQAAQTAANTGDSQEEAA